MPKERMMDGVRVLGGLYIVDSKAPIWCIKFRRPPGQPGGVPDRDYLLQGFKDELDKAVEQLGRKNYADGLTRLEVRRVRDWDYNPVRS